MTTYQYSPLLDSKTDIRLINLLPGQFDDDLVAEIFHAALIEPPSRSKSEQRWSLEEVQSSLPPGWTVFETAEGRYLFENPRKWVTSWDHPDAKVDRANYEALPDEADAGFEPKYEALSYTWGDASDSQHILWLQSGQATAASPSTVEPPPRPRDKLQIQENLAMALRSLRYEDASRTLWVDAVCINQTNIPERNAHVPHMGTIYRLASRVVVWLGPASASSQGGLATLDYLGSQLEYSRRNFLLDTPGTANRGWCLREVVLPYDEATWRGVLDIIARPWFDRLWVTQEIQLANRHAIVCCGGRALATISWSHLRRAILGIFIRQQPLPPEIRDRCNDIYALAEHMPGRPLHTLLFYGQRRLCRDPRDKIYALLSLFPDDVAAELRPDYAAPVADVYRDASLLIMTRTRRLGFFCSGGGGGGGGGSRPAMPSWVPDWSLPYVQGIAVSYWSSITSACAKFEPPGTLQIWGVPCGTVQAVSDRVAVHAEAAPMRAVSDFFRKYAAASPAYPTGESSVAALALTLLMGCSRQRYPSTGSRYPLQGKWTEQLDDYLSGRNTSSAGEQDLARTISAIVRQDQVLFSTDKGHLGSTAASARPGDQLYAVLGCTGMVILRPRDAAAYEVVGESYVHGFADAEVVLGPVAAPWRVQCESSSAGRWSLSFCDSSTYQTTGTDPRLGQLPSEWEHLADSPPTADDPPAFVRFRNKVSGKLINSDPRMLPEALRARGVDLQTIKLV